MQPELLTKMIDLARRGYSFTAADGHSVARSEAFLRFKTFDGCHSVARSDTIPVRSAGFREWFTYACYCELDSLPTSRQFHAILDLFEGEAHSDESRQGWPVYRRVGRVGPRRLPDQIILDLANSRYQFVEIAPTGWKLAGGPTALFQTSRSTLSLPAPVSTPAGDTRALASPSPLDTLRSCLNLPSRAAWLRCLAWLLSAFHPYGPFPFLIIQGPPSSGKSLAARVLRYMVDPSSAPSPPSPPPSATSSPSPVTTGSSPSTTSPPSPRPSPMPSAASPPASAPPSARPSAPSPTRYTNTSAAPSCSLSPSVGRARPISPNAPSSSPSRPSPPGPAPMTASCRPWTTSRPRSSEPSARPSARRSAACRK